MGRMASSTCIQRGMRPLRLSVTPVKSTPRVRVTSVAWAEARAAASRSFAPQAWAMKARKPTPKADTMPPTSQPTVVVAPTAAVASVPREPTMAVSMYCTAVCISCSSIVGQARARITFIMPKSSRFHKLRIPVPRRSLVVL